MTTPTPAVAAFESVAAPNVVEESIAWFASTPKPVYTSAPPPPPSDNFFELEDSSGFFALEDDSGLFLLES